MRVLLVASPAHPTVARFTPTLATLAAQGCSIEACLPLSPYGGSVHADTRHPRRTRVLH